MTSWVEIEVAFGFLKPNYLYAPKKGSQHRQEGLETELMTEKEPVTVIGSG